MKFVYYREVEDKYREDEEDVVKTLETSSYVLSFLVVKKHLTFRGNETFLLLFNLPKLQSMSEVQFLH